MIGFSKSVDPFESLMYSTANIKNYAGVMDASIVNNYITPLAQQYVSETIQRNNWYNSEAYYDQVRNYVVSKGPSIVHQDFIMPLSTPDQFRLANLTMQRWIMAEPVVRQAYVDGQICGYEDTYIDHEPGMVSEAHSDWRHVMNGVVQGDYASIYVDNYSGDKPKLSIGEISDILTTWSTANLLMDLGVNDITDPLADSNDDPTFTEKPVEEESED
jgi:hypothetical protein